MHKSPQWSAQSAASTFVASDLYIIGTGGLAKEVAQLARRIDPGAERWPMIHYVTHDVAEMNQPRPFGAIDYLDEALATLTSPTDVVIGIGHAQLRRRIALSLSGHAQLRFPNLIHPRVELDPTLIALGVGNIITQGVVMTCDIALGDFNLLNLNVTIGHDSRLGSYNVINPGCSISGNVTINDACLFGTGSRVLETLYVADDVALGAGAVLTRSIHTVGGTYVGVPARRICT